MKIKLLLTAGLVISSSLAFAERVVVNEEVDDFYGKVCSISIEYPHSADEWSSVMHVMWFDEMKEMTIGVEMGVESDQVFTNMELWSVSHRGEKDMFTDMNAQYEPDGGTHFYSVEFPNNGYFAVKALTALMDSGSITLRSSVFEQDFKYDAISQDASKEFLSCVGSDFRSWIAKQGV
ncbi:hypothetical protein [Psychromonas ossibalaenae]|uniref:hypothetical protein n=1 Tax=Psychromonas ossibalaenae TaxID=444922 RepID=UPI0003674721|nr:hypothetical protein [Psychromonas ossibalaenae]